VGARPGLKVLLIGVSILSVAAGILLWVLGSRHANPTLIPTPAAVWRATHQAADNGTLWSDIGISVERAIEGWVLGSAIAIPLGVLAGTSAVIRAIVDPYIHFFRAVPALALVSLFLLWFGIGEASKVYLIAWAVFFTVIVTTAEAASGVARDKIDAARCFGASRNQILWQVIVPATVPGIFTGMRLGLATAYLVVVAAEELAANSGIGWLIWNARTYFRTDQIFLGVFCFGILGFTSDRLWRFLGRTVFHRFLRARGNY
jgi:ABC-type nitrate/sulfonate/bicarbonate transport system permease component